MFRLRLRCYLRANRRSLLQCFGLLLVLLALSTTAVAVTNGPQSEIVEAGKVVEGDLYLRGRTVAIDGTVRGTAAIAAEKITLNGTIENDVYLMAETVVVNGRVGGDAVLLGRQVRINGQVEKDALAIARTVAVNGTVGEDLRLAGEVLLLDSRTRVAEDVTVAGESLESRVGSRIGRNLNVWGARALLAGTVQKNTTGSLAAAVLHGIFDGNVNLSVANRLPWRIPFWPEPALALPEIPPGLTVADSAQIGGNLTYRSPQAAQLGKKAWIAGSTVREPLSLATPAVRPAFDPVRTLGRQLQRFASLLLAGGLLLQFKPNWLQSLARTASHRPCSSLGWGLVALLAVAGVAIAIAGLAALLAAFFGFTLGGLMWPILALGMLAPVTLLVSCGIFISFIPQVALSYGGGRMLLQRVKPDWAARPGLSLAVGLMGFVAIAAIPIAGQILSFATICMGLGAFWIRGGEWRSQRARVPERTEASAAMPSFDSEPESRLKA